MFTTQKIEKTAIYNDYVIIGVSLIVLFVKEPNTNLRKETYLMKKELLALGGLKNNY